MPTAEEMAVINKMKRTSEGAYAKSMEKAPKVKGQVLPGGINGGIARLTNYKLNLDKNGKPYLQLVGIVIQPTEHEGKRAQVGHFLSPSRGGNGRPGKTVGEKYDDLFSDLKLLGVNTDGMTERDVLEKSVDQLAELCKQKVPFEFNTWQPDPNRQAFVFIQKKKDESEIPEIGQVTWEGDNEESDEVPSDPDGSLEEGEYEGEGDDPPAEDEDGATDYVDPDEPSEDEDDDLPQIGYVYGYRVNQKASIQNCEVMAVSYDDEHVDLKRQKDGKEFKAVAFSKLEDAVD